MIVKVFRECLAMVGFFKVMLMVLIIAIGLPGDRVTAGIAGLRLPFVHTPFKQFPLAFSKLSDCSDDSPPGVIHALLIGINDYPSLPKLGGPANDIALLSQTLIEKGIKTENVMLLLDNEATTDNFLKILTQLVSKIQCGDQLLIHFSGHSSEGDGLAFFDGFLSIFDLNKILETFVDHRIGTFLSLDAGEISVSSFGRLLGRRGEIAIFLPTSMPIEVKPESEEKTFGIFSWCLAQSLKKSSVPVKISNLAAGFNKCLAESYSGILFLSFIANNWDMVLRFPSVAPTLDTESVIEFTNLPPEQRGLVINIKQPRFRLEGRLKVTDTPLATLVNEAVVEVKEGRFAHEIELKTGDNTITVTALFADGRVAQHNAILRYQGDIEALYGEGRSIALLIGNQHYQQWSPLKTPIADVTAMAKVLREQYGFVTQLADGPGGMLELELVDADHRQIGRTLNRLSKILQEPDRLLIFYAGHGALRNETAFWIPIDGELDDNTTWFSSHTLIDQLRAIPARQILVITDSCYAGAMFRAGEIKNLPADKEERIKTIERLSKFPVRSIIASGGKEPVLDGGGDGHSVFADKLLKALKEPNHSIFTADELYINRIRELVIAGAEQTPQHGTLHRALADKGATVLGEFVFIKSSREKSESEERP